MENRQAFTDVRTLRMQARQHIGEGAVTAGYAADRGIVLQLLNEALATEIVCVLRYRRHHFMAKGIEAKGIAAEFLVHATEELAHAELLAERIAIDSYRDFIQYLGAKDSTTRRMLETILAAEEEHADELADLLQSGMAGGK